MVRACACDASEPSALLSAIEAVPHQFRAILKRDEHGGREAEIGALSAVLHRIRDLDAEIASPAHLCVCQVISAEVARMGGPADAATAGVIRSAAQAATLSHYTRPDVSVPPLLFHQSSGAGGDVRRALDALDPSDGGVCTCRAAPRDEAGDRAELGRAPLAGVRGLRSARIRLPRARAQNPRAGHARSDRRWRWRVHGRRRFSDAACDANRCA